VILPLFCHPISAGPVDRGGIGGRDVGMDSSDLTHQRCDSLAEKYGAMQGEPGRILKRMRQLRFPARDETLQLTEDAFALMQQLRMHVHDLGCRQIPRPESTGGNGSDEVFGTSLGFVVLVGILKVFTTRENIKRNRQLVMTANVLLVMRQLFLATLNVNRRPQREKA
jgi:hypothetical protein